MSEADLPRKADSPGTQVGIRGFLRDFRGEQQSQWPDAGIAFGLPASHKTAIVALYVRDLRAEIEAFTQIFVMPRMGGIMAPFICDGFAGAVFRSLLCRANTAL